MRTKPRRVPDADGRIVGEVATSWPTRPTPSTGSLYRLAVSAEDDERALSAPDTSTRIAAAHAVIERAPARAADLFQAHGVVTWLDQSPPTDESAALLAAILDEPLMHACALPAAKALAAHAGTGHTASIEALIARLDVIHVQTGALAAAALFVDPVEAFENLHDRYRADREWRFWLAERLTPESDPRWIDEALLVADEDPQAAAITLAQMSTPRARSELLQWTEREDDFARVKPFIEALARLAEPRASPLLVRWLERVIGGPGERLVLSALGKCGRVADLPDIHALEVVAREPALFGSVIAAIVRDGRS